jgi:phospholipid/cholesterol/gamma-HCH transport system substrate-binding protein
VYLSSVIVNLDVFAHRTSYAAVLPDAAGLRAHDAVKMAGVTIGEVTGVHLRHGQAVVSFSIASDRELLTSTKVGIRWRNLIGQKYLYLYPGDSGPRLASHATLPASQAVMVPDVGAFLNSLGPFLSAVDPSKANEVIQALDQAFTGNEAKLQQLLANSATVAKTVGGLDTKLGPLLDDVHTVVAQIASRSASLDATITNLTSLSRTAAQRNDSLLTLIDQVNTLGGQVDQLLTRSGGDIDGAIRSLQTILGVLENHQSDLDTGLGGLPKALNTYFVLGRVGQFLNSAGITILCIAGDSPNGVGPCLERNLLPDLVSGKPTNGGPATTATTSPAAKVAGDPSAPYEFALSPGSGP